MPQQELHSLVIHFSSLFRDGIFMLQTGPLIRLPFSQEDLEIGLHRLPIMKALVIIW